MTHHDSFRVYKYIVSCGHVHWLVVWQLLSSGEEVRVWEM